MTSTSPILRLGRLCVLAALALHLCGSVVGPWAHASGLTVVSALATGEHIDPPHAEAAAVDHETCTLCQALGQRLVAPQGSAILPTLVEVAASYGGGLSIPPAPHALPSRARDPPASALM